MLSSSFYPKTLEVVSEEVPAEASVSIVANAKSRQFKGVLTNDAASSQPYSLILLHLWIKLDQALSAWFILSSSARVLSKWRKTSILKLV